MNNNRGNNRRRGRGNNNNNNRQGGGQQLNRIDSRARGNAPQLLEKYRKLALDAHLNGDRVTEEYNLQFADHYFRVIADQRLRLEEQRNRPRDDRWQEGGDADRNESDREDGGEYGADYGMDSDYTAYDQPHRREREERPPRQQQEAREERSAPQRAPERQSDEAAEERPAEEPSGERAVYEPPENPFVRENRVSRGLRPRRDDRRPRREPREAEDAAEADDAPAAFDPAILPPAISAGREEAAEPTAADAEGEAKPRRRTRRPKPPADDAGETLEVLS